MPDYKKHLAKIAENNIFYIEDAISSIQETYPEISKNSIRQAIYRLHKTAWLSKDGEHKTGYYRIVTNDAPPLSSKRDVVTEQEVIIHFYEQYNISKHKYNFMFRLKENYYIFIAEPHTYSKLKTISIFKEIIIFQEENYTCEVIQPRILMDAKNWTAVLFMDLLHLWNAHYMLVELTCSDIGNFPDTPPNLPFFEQYSSMLANTGRIRTSKGCRIKKREIFLYLKRIVLYEYYTECIHLLTEQRENATTEYIRKHAERELARFSKFKKNLNITAKEK